MRGINRVNNKFYVPISEKVLLTINDKNKTSIHVCEKTGGIWGDTIEAYNDAEGQHLLRRYWIIL